MASLLIVPPSIITEHGTRSNASYVLQPGDMMGGIKIFCDGRPMEQKWGKYKMTLASGEEIVLGLKYNMDLFNPKITYKG